MQTSPRPGRLAWLSASMLAVPPLTLLILSVAVIVELRDHADPTHQGERGMAMLLCSTISAIPCLLILAVVYRSIILRKAGPASVLGGLFLFYIPILAIFGRTEALLNLLTRISQMNP